jgi:hypothetical protein
MNTELVVDLLKPFECLEHLLTALYILTEYSSYQVNILNSLIIRATGVKTTCSQINALKDRIKYYPEKYGTSFFINKDLKNSLDLYLKEQNTIEFSTSIKMCIFCGSSLNLLNKRKSKAVCYYFATKPKQVTLNLKECASCDSLHYLNYAEKDGKRIFFEDTLSEKFLAFTDESIFERLLLDGFTADLISKHSSFKGFASSFNLLFKCREEYKNGNNFDRICLNEIRLNQAWFYLQYLKINVEIFNKFPKPAPIMKDLNKSISLDLKPILSKYFIQKWTGIFFSNLFYYELYF